MATLPQTSIDRTQQDSLRDRLLPQAARYGGQVLLYLLLIACSLWFILPLIWMVMTSFMPITQVGKFPPEWIPVTWQFENYSEALRFWNFNVTFRNTVIITVVTMIGNLTSSTLVAYG
ncbi:MAG: hypothetical protein K8J31_11235, partial [Anaerolineae bacterium]|nr:hypothetical protein [Anaerolineae bacterium]